MGSDGDRALASKDDAQRIRGGQWAEVELQLREQMSSAEENHPRLLEWWLQLVLVLLRQREVRHARLVVVDYAGLAESISPRHLDLAESALRAVETSDAHALRAATERFSQGRTNWAESGYPPLLSAVDAEAGGVAEAHDYTTSSFLLWRSGLKALVASRWAEAQEFLFQSMGRYELGGMLGDFLWSWFDTVLSYLFMDDLQGAIRLASDYESVGPGSKFHFMVETALRGYRDLDPDSSITLRQLMARHWPEYRHSEYPAIFASFERHLKTMHETSMLRGVALELRQTGSSALQEQAAAQAGRKATRFIEMISRVARSERNEIAALARVAASVNLGATRPDVEQIAAHCAISQKTVAGQVPWDQGLLFLVTEATRPDGVVEIAGSCKLQFPVDACWRKHERARVAKKKFMSTFSVLQFSAEKSYGLEMAGNVVKPQLRGEGIGRFHVQARLLFVHIHVPPKIDHLFADLLTVDTNGQYAFFESVVRQLLGGVDYDQADYLRYAETEIVRAFLGATDTGSGPVEILVHALPETIQEQFGAVRTITQRTQRVLERYGFARSDNFDLLDGGQYFQLPLSTLQRLPVFRDFVLRSTPEALVDPALITFAPRDRRPSDYFCVRAQASIDEDRLELCVEERLARRLGLSGGECVRAILD